MLSPQPSEMTQLRGLGRGKILRVLFFLVSIGFVGNAALRAQFTWNDGNHGTSDNINDPLNWVGGVAPTGTPDLTFGTSTSQTVNFNLSSLVNSVTFTGTTGFGFNGSNGLALAGGGFVANNSTSVSSIVVNVPIQLNGAVTVTNNSTTAGLLINNTISGTGGLTIVNNTSASLQLNNTATYTGGTTITTGTFQLGNGTNTGVTLSSDVANSGTLRFFVASGDNSVAYGNVISGTGIVALNGTGTPGTVTFSGANTYSGDTQVNSVTLADGAANSFSPNSAITVNSASGALKVNFNETIAGLQNGGSGGPVNIFNGGTALTVNTGTLNPTAFGGLISGAGGLALSGSGSLGLSAANTYTGGTTINGGTLFVANTGGGSAAGTGIITVGSGATLEFGQPGGGTTTASVSGNITNNGNVLFNLSAPAGPFNNTISGAGTLTKIASAALTLTAANTYTGGTTLTSGILAVTNTSGSGIGTGALSIASSSTFQIGAIGSGATGSISPLIGVILGGANANFNVNLTSAISLTNAISGIGQFEQNGTGTTTLMGTNAQTFTGNTLVDAGTLADGATNSFSPNALMVVKSGTNLQVNFNETVAGLNGSSSLGGAVNIASGAILSAITSSNRIFPGVISGLGGFTVGGGGTQTLGGANTYTGVTAINSGSTLQLGNSSAGFTGSLAGAVVDNGTLAFDQASASNYNNPTSGTGAMVVNNNSTDITIAIPNTFTGGTTLNHGTVTLTNTTGSALGTGAVVSNGGIIGGNGSFSGPLTLNANAGVFGGVHNGLANTFVPGTLTTGAATFGGNAGLVFGINNATGTAGTNWGLINISGALAITATSGSPFLIILDSIDPNTNQAGSASNFNPASSYSWEMVSATGGITGFAANAFNPQITFSGQPGFANGIAGGSFFVSQVGNHLFLNFSPVPEPSTWALMLAGSAMMAGGILRRKRAQRGR